MREPLAKRSMCLDAACMTQVVAGLVERALHVETDRMGTEDLRDQFLPLFSLLPLLMPS